MPKKPTPAKIRDATPLSRKLPIVEPHRVGFRCQVCGSLPGVDDLEAWREHDERDRPLPGNEALIFLGVGSEHRGCRKELDDHPRLYSQDDGYPGALPLLCGPCDYRAGRRCSHPDLTLNGGKGLLVKQSDPLRGAIVCGGGDPHFRRLRVPRPALECAGRSVKGRPEPRRP